MNEAPYTSDERRRMDEAGGYWNHAGGLAPILKAGPWIGPGNGQCRFRRRQRSPGTPAAGPLSPPANRPDRDLRTRGGDRQSDFAEWLRHPRREDRVDGRRRPRAAPPAAMTSSTSTGRCVPKARVATSTPVSPAKSSPRPYPPIIFSIADCLRDFLSDRYEVFYGDGHLTCFKPQQ